MHFNMFCMYVSLTKGQGDDHAMCNTIEQAQTFHNTLYNFKHIDLSLMYATLTVCDMECVSLFLFSSSIKE